LFSCESGKSGKKGINFTNEVEITGFSLDLLTFGNAFGADCCCFRKPAVLRGIHFVL